MTWSFLHGSVEMQTGYAAKRFTFVVNCYQAAILDLFNEKDLYSSGEIQELVQVPKDAYEGAMKQLCNPKYKVLMKNPKKPIFKDED